MSRQLGIMCIMGLLRATGCVLAAGLLGGCGVPSFLVTPVSTPTGLKEEVVEEGRGWFPPKLVVIEIEGLLINTRDGGLLEPEENKVSLFVQQMERAEKDPDVRAVVLRINSPGGTVAATETLFTTVGRFRERTGKPVVASAQEVAASGGYYVACAADRIVVQPTSIVGSIGVIFHTFDFSGTLAKIGAHTEAIKSGPLKDMGSPLKPLEEPERRVMQGIVDDFYARFKEVVRVARKLDPTKLAAVSDGRVFTGQQAVDLGLADSTGQLVDAIKQARELAKVPGAKVVIYRRPYGYGGSIYAAGPDLRPRANVIQLNLAPPRALLPSGFYYLWEPG